MGHVSHVILQAFYKEEVASSKQMQSELESYQDVSVCVCVCVYVAN